MVNFVLDSSNIIDRASIEKDLKFYSQHTDDYQLYIRPFVIDSSLLDLLDGNSKKLNTYNLGIINCSIYNSNNEITGYGYDIIDCLHDNLRIISLRKKGLDNKVFVSSVFGEEKTKKYLNLIFFSFEESAVINNYFN